MRCFNDFDEFLDLGTPRIGFSASLADAGGSFVLHRPGLRDAAFQPASGSLGLHHCAQTGESIAVESQEATLRCADGSKYAFPSSGGAFSFLTLPDGIFNGLGWSDEAYEWYAGITEGVAAIGTAVLGVFHMSGRYKAAKYAQKFLGKGYYKAGSGRWVSADGLRQVRWDTTRHLFHGVPTNPHFNLETFRFAIGGPIRPGRAISDIHLWLTFFGFDIYG